MARKTKEDALATRCAIVDAAIEVFSEQGVSRTSLAEIAKRAGVTRGAIYWHFANKADLLNAMWDEVLLPFEPIAEASERVDEPDPLGRMAELFLRMFFSVAEDPRRQKLFRILLEKCEVVDDNNPIHLRRVNCHLEGFQRIETVLRNAQTRGQVPETLNLRLASIAVISYVDGLLANLLMMEELFDVKQEMPILIEAMIQTLRLGLPCHSTA